MLFRKAELGGEVPPDRVTVEQGDRAASDLAQPLPQQVGRRGFSCARQACEEDRKTSLSTTEHCPASLDESPPEARLDSATRGSRISGRCSFRELFQLRAAGYCTRV